MPRFAQGSPSRRVFAGSAKKTAAVFASLLSLTGTAAAEPHCPGRFPNPVTDVCWSCVFPIVVGTNVPLGKVPDDSYTPDTDASALCVCGENVNVEGGVNLSFWEPLRTAEVVRHAWCSPTLGGVTLADNQGITRSPDHGRGQDGRNTRFANVHWFVSPWLFVLEAVSDISCLEQAPWDLAYLSELDPLWDDTLAGFLLAPDAALFANPAAQAARRNALLVLGLPRGRLSAFGLVRVGLHLGRRVGASRPPLRLEALARRRALVRPREEGSVRPLLAADSPEGALEDPVDVSLARDRQDGLRDLLSAARALDPLLGPLQDLCAGRRRRRAPSLPAPRLLRTKVLDELRDSGKARRLRPTDSDPISFPTLF